MSCVLGFVLKWHDNSDVSHLRDASAKFPCRTEFQSLIVNFRAKVCVIAKNLALVLHWIKKIEAASSLKDLINSKSVTRKDFSDYEELDLMLATEVK